MTCDVCDRARENPEIGKIIRGCYTCAVRYASRLPPRAREVLEQEIVDPANLEQFRADVLAEHSRRMAWKRAKATFDE